MIIHGNRPEPILYLNMFHGRKTVSEELDNWGYDGPIYELGSLHVTYKDNMRLISPDGSVDVELPDLFVGDLIVDHEGNLYGDFIITGVNVMLERPVVRLTQGVIDRIKLHVARLRLTDTQLERLYHRFERLRHGGNFQTRESIRKTDKPEPFNADRVRELLEKENPITQTNWLKAI